MTNSFGYVENSLPNYSTIGSYTQKPEYGQTYKYTGNEKLRYNPMSSKSNLVDILGGIGLGLSNTQQQKQTAPFYYVNANYKGEGRADTSLGRFGFDKERAEEDRRFDGNRFNMYKLAALLGAHADRSRGYQNNYGWSYPIEPLPTGSQLSDTLNNMFGNGYLGDLNAGSYIPTTFDNVYGSGYYPKGIY